MGGLITILVILAVVGIVFYGWYATIIARRNKADEAFAGIDVQLRKRHDLVPNVLKIAQTFMEHERGLLEEITKLRAQAVEKAASTPTAPGTAERLGIEAQLQAKMGQFFVAVENYPDLKSDQTMVQAMTTYNEVEEHIAAARRFYNAAVNQLRNSIQIWPGSMIAGMIAIEDRPMYEAEETARAPVDAGAYLKAPGTA